MLLHWHLSELLLVSKLIWLPDRVSLPRILVISIRISLVLWILLRCLRWILSLRVIKLSTLWIILIGILDWWLWLIDILLDGRLVDWGLGVGRLLVNLLGLLWYLWLDLRDLLQGNLLSRLGRLISLLNRLRRYYWLKVTTKNINNIPSIFGLNNFNFSRSIHWLGLFYLLLLPLSWF